MVSVHDYMAAECHFKYDSFLTVNINYLQSYTYIKKQVYMLQKHLYDICNIYAL